MDLLCLGELLWSLGEFLRPRCRKLEKDIPIRKNEREGFCSAKGRTSRSFPPWLSGGSAFRASWFLTKRDKNREERFSLIGERPTKETEGWFTLSF